jgi:mono/diheme cytochrome c family protein
MKKMMLILLFPWTAAALDAPPLIGELGCGVCHSDVPIDPQVRERSGSLADVRTRFEPVALFEYLQNPKSKRNDLGATRMPDYRFRPEESLALTLYLMASDEGLAEMTAAHTNVTAEVGQRIYLNQNCGGCHVDASRPRPTRLVAPMLGSEGTRAKRAWLKKFLAHPEPVRPFGYIPGTGTRMPDFKLSAREVKTISNWLMEQKQPSQVEVEPPSPLSAFSVNKAEALLTRRYGCIGCHQLEGRGGRIGPDLTSVSTRRPHAYVQAIIESPQHAALQPIMPKVPMPKKTSELIATYLSGVDGKSAALEDAPLVTLRAEASELPSGTAGLYQTYCVACHGATGKGDGFNADFMEIKPSSHADEAMASIPDDTLYDWIHGGGFVMNKSAEMPAWGATLEPDQIRSLVAHIRALCQCEGPKWSK